MQLAHTINMIINKMLFENAFEFEFSLVDCVAVLNRDTVEVCTEADTFVGVVSVTLLVLELNVEAVDVEFKRVVGVVLSIDRVEVVWILVVVEDVWVVVFVENLEMIYSSNVAWFTTHSLPRH